MKKIGLIVPYFGEFPNYFDLFLKSCAFNSSIDWLIFTDNEVDELPSNVKIVPMTFGQLKSLISYKLNTTASLPDPYKLCDYKPAYGKIFADYLEKYDFWGHCDIDLIFGDLRQFITEEILTEHDKIFMDGHLILYRNTKKVNHSFDLIGDKDTSFRYCIQVPEVMYFDEWGINLLYEKYGLRQYNNPQYADILPQSPYFRNVLFGDDQHHKNQFFQWENGHVYKFWEENGEIQQREYSYIHLQKRAFPPHPSSLTKEEAFVISAYGFYSSNDIPEINKANYKQVFHYHVKRLKGITPIKVKRTLKGLIL